MPHCNENYKEEITDGLNLRTVKCRYCDSIILSPSTATFSNLECDLPFMELSKRNEANQLGEKISHFWCVKDMLIFQNVGFSNTVGDKKYLACADCDAGPIGYFNVKTQWCYVALNRVKYC